MRIIGGKHKGQRLSFLNTPNTRPLRDFVKENIFNILNHSDLINIKIKDSKILDLYSGVGSFGIECVSRYAKSVIFVEHDPSAIKVLRKNLKLLSIKNEASLYDERTSKFLNKKNLSKFDIVFFDPPFLENDYLDELKSLKKLNILNDNHLIIIHRETIRKISNNLWNPKIAFCLLSFLLPLQHFDQKDLNY
jgi:16S rRNA (guanine966-N2)-methyltransferase